jgi:hypothetical protein
MGERYTLNGARQAVAALAEALGTELRLDSYAPGGVGIRCAIETRGGRRPFTDRRMSPAEVCRCIAFALQVLDYERRAD